MWLDKMKLKETSCTKRPQLSKNLKSDDFKEYYFLKEELKDFCRQEGLKISGSKNQLENRIIYYLDTGKLLNDKKINSNSNSKKNNVSNEKISLNSVIGENFKCSEDKREFFENEIGKSFKFKVKFQKWLKSNPNKTYQDAINEYYNIQKSNKKTKIDKQFQYNKYIRDFFKNNKNKTLKDAIKCWNYKKNLKGHNNYESSDLNVLNTN